MAETLIKIPMVGKVMEVKVKVGELVHKKDVIAILDSMKMKVPMFSPVDGTIKELNATVGQVLKKGHVLAIIA
jgi:acetyl-CoA carboxylase biotin carboxyl carrier protein